MLAFAEITFDPSSIVGWIIAGLVAAWLASKMTEEPSYGLMGDLIAGGLGGLAGGLLYGFFTAGAGFWGGVLVALVAAGIVVGSTRVIVGLSSR